MSFFKGRATDCSDRYRQANNKHESGNKLKLQLFVRLCVRCVQMMLYLTCDLKVKGLNVLQYASKKGATKLLNEMLKTPYVFMNPVTEQFDVTFLIPDSVPEPMTSSDGRAGGPKPLSCLELIVNNRLLAPLSGKMKLV